MKKKNYVSHNSHQLNVTCLLIRLFGKQFPLVADVSPWSEATLVFPGSISPVIKGSVIN